MSQRAWRTGLLATVLLAVTAAGAAGFDCRKASTAAEHTICANPALNTLDARLSALYTRAEARDKTVAAAQRAWLSGTRDKCAGKECLEKAYAARIEQLRAQAGPCPVTEASLLGGWIPQTPFDFDDFTLTIDDGQRDFNAHLHDSPAAFGTWKLVDCRLDLNDSAGVMNESFEIMALNHDRLKTRSMQDPDTTVLVLRKVPAEK